LTWSWSATATISLSRHNYDGLSRERGAEIAGGKMCDRRRLSIHHNSDEARATTEFKTAKAPKNAKRQRAGGLNG
jgi:hypothetical protein